MNGKLKSWVLSQLKPWLVSSLFWLAALLAWELTVHTAAFDSLERFGPALVFVAGGALVLAALTTLPTIAGRVAAWVLPPVLCLIYAVQLVYHHIFGAFLSLAFVSMGGNALAEFWTIAVSAVIACLPRLALLLAPVAGFYVLRRFGILPKENRQAKELLLLLGSGVFVLYGGALDLPQWGGTGANTPYAVWHSSTATVDRWADRFGVLTAEALDFRRLVFGGNSLAEGGLDLTAGSGVLRNVVDDMDFDALDRLTDDQALQNLNRYFSALTGTGKNSCTGMFEGYNLVVVCAEAFSPYLMSPELTPTLWRLSHEGIVFENFYNSFPSLTTDGEYGLCMGLMPDASRISFAASMDNYVPFCLGNVFSAAGIEARAYHNNTSTFYNRVNTHTNMGYQFKAIGFGLDMEPGSPTSDLEMMEKTVDDYIGQEPFHAYYMTFSGHAYYSFTDNDMSARNRDLVRGMKGSEPLLAYYACQLELERAMTYLMDRLEEAGVADHTVVVLTGDHFPYGLPDEDYETLAGDAVDEPFWRYRNSFMCWTGGLDEPIVVDEYCCTHDILPTVLNLFGMEYDSRLLTGRDVLADCTHAALLKDGSFLTKDLLYDGSTGELTWRGEPGDEADAQALLEALENQFAVAAAILDTDYYGFAFSNLDLTAGPVEHPDYASFADIAGTWYEEDVELLATWGALSGGGTGDFHGDETANRATMLTMVTRWLQLSGRGGELPFTDVEEGRWFYNTVAAAWNAGLLPETEEFRPLDPVTEQDAEEFLTAAAQYAGLEEPEALAEQAVAFARTAQAEHDGPSEEFSRGTAACALAELLRLAETEQDGSVTSGS